MALSRFELTYSESLFDGWLAKESLTLRAADGMANVIASSEPLDPATDSKAYAAAQDQVLGELPGFLQHAFERREMFGDRRGFMRRFEWLEPDGVAIMQVQLYYADAGRGYTATATTPKSEFGRYEFTLEDVLESLVIKPAGEPGDPFAAPPAALSIPDEQARLD